MNIRFGGFRKEIEKSEGNLFAGFTNYHLLIGLGILLNKTEIGEALLVYGPSASLLLIGQLSATYCCKSKGQLRLREEYHYSPCTLMNQNKQHYTGLLWAISKNCSLRHGNQ